MKFARHARQMIMLLISILTLIGCAVPGRNMPAPSATQPPSQVADRPQPQVTDAGAPQSATRLRLINNSDVAIERIVVIFPRERIEFGSIAPGGTTEYKPVEHGVYAYAAYELAFDGRTIQQPVIDWVGEGGRTGGSFTYVLSIDPERPEYTMIQSEVHQE